MTSFADILDAAGNLSVEEQETLLVILRRRLAERNRAQLIRDVEEARAEFREGRARPTPVCEIMDEAGSGA